jgi:mRNA interferase MazF
LVSASPARPIRGDLWLLDFGDPIGHEQGGRRPALVISGDALNRRPSRLVTVLPVTARDRGVPAHVPLDPASTGLHRHSFALTDHHRVVSQDRLDRRLGTADAATMAVVETWLRIFLDL